MSHAFREKGHFTVIVTSRAEGFSEQEEIEQGVILRLFDRKELRTIKVAKQTIEIAKRYCVDWIEGADHWGECATLLKVRPRPPVVVKMHYNDVLSMPRYSQAWYGWQRVMIDLACLRQWRSIRAERYSLEHADLLLAPCERILQEAKNQDVRLPHRIAVIPNPISSMNAWKNVEARHPTLLLIGRIDIGKGLPYVKSLLERLMPLFPDLILEIRGRDSYARGLGSVRDWFLKKLGPLHKHIRFLGFLNSEELNDAYSRAWVVIVPSRWDTFPQVVLEAMIRSKAIVASPHGGMPEMLSETDCVIADPAEFQFSKAVADFLVNPEKRQCAGESALKKARYAYNPNKIATDYITIVNSVV
jgi:glycosyltransferase involved in cell wall biosynthesis